MAFSDVALAKSPVWYAKLDEISGATFADASGTLTDGTFFGTPLFGEPGATGEGTSIYFDNSSSADSPSNSLLFGSFIFDVHLFAKFTAAVPSVTLWEWVVDTSNFIRFTTVDSGVLQFQIRRSGTYRTIRTSSTYDPASEFLFVGFGFDNGTVKIYVNGVSVPTFVAVNNNVTQAPNGGGPFGIGNNGRMWVDDTLVFRTTALTDADVAELYAAANVPVPLVVPLALHGYLQSAAAVVPLRLVSIESSPAGSVPLLLQSADPAHYQAEVAAWSPSVVLDGVDVSASLVGDVEIDRAENQSGIASFELLVPAGAVDLGSYERKTVAITFDGRDSAGSLLYPVRRFTGTTTIAEFNPDAGTVSVTASNDLQGLFEAMPREVIDKLIPGYWSEHVFDDAADGWRYAVDRLSTIPYEMHVDSWGRLVVVPWAASPAYRTFTDTARFGGTLRLTRVSRGDLITHVRINFDFVYTRLRHREISVNFINTLGLCGWLNGQGNLPSKSMIASAIDGNQWTRIGAVRYDDLPTVALADICGGTNFAPNSNSPLFCLGAHWKAARRWGQTVTERHPIDVIASDLAEAVGVQPTNFDYSVEAVFDTGDYERITEYDAAPTGAVLMPQTADYQLDAVDAERTGRIAMQAAQVCAIERAKTLILGRARGNRVTFDPVYDPTVDLSKTLRVSGDYLDATGKVVRLQERLGVRDGNPQMTVELAISRHGGSGVAVNDPIVAPPTPTQPDETPTPRVYFLQQRSGGVLNAPPDDEDWDGWITNAFGAARTDPNNLYRERFVVRMPEIEETARQATTISQSTSYGVAVPQDSLTLSN